MPLAAKQYSFSLVFVLGASREDTNIRVNYFNHQSGMKKRYEKYIRVRHGRLFLFGLLSDERVRTTKILRRTKLRNATAVCIGTTAPATVTSFGSDSITWIATEHMSSVTFHPAPREEWILLSQGAEAKIWKLNAVGGGAKAVRDAQFIICKERFSKAYRHPDLDERLTKSRCRSESRILEKCAKKSDLRVPEVIRLEPPFLYMEFVEGLNLKSHLLDQGNASRISYTSLAKMMGETIGKVHNLGVIHGDLTTSNMILKEFSTESTETSFELVMIDFGLAKSSSSVEEQAVDLYVLERALESTHPDLPDNFLDMILDAYATITTAGSDSKKSGKQNQQSTLQRLEQVRQRGRKRECFG